jgi:hypothetical protein
LNKSYYIHTYTPSLQLSEDYSSNSEPKDSFEVIEALEGRLPTVLFALSASVELLSATAGFLKMTSGSGSGSGSGSLIEEGGYK